MADNVTCVYLFFYVLERKSDKVGATVCSTPDQNHWITEKSFCLCQTEWCSRRFVSCDAILRTNSAKHGYSEQAFNELTLTAK